MCFSPDPENPTRTKPSARVAGLMGLVALLLGCWAAWFYHAAGLTLSHYDAKAHLVVARRVIDSLTPGWRQIGAVWLPLPHLLNLVPVQVDTFYRTGASAVAISIAASALTAFATARIVTRATGSRIAAAAAAAVVMLNPDLLYLQATPMTEPLLLGLLVLATSFTWDFVENPTVRSRRLAGWTLLAACLTRYESWPVAGALLVATVVAMCRSGRSPGHSACAVARVAIYPAAAVLAFLLLGRLTTGRWFITSGFFVPDNMDIGNPFRAIASVWWGAHVVCGHGLVIAGVVGALAAIALTFRDRTHSGLVLAVALLAVGVLPAYAFFSGHPFRIRYMLPLVPGLGVCAGIGLACVTGRWRVGGAVLLVGLAVVEARPFRPDSPMVLEAQWDSGNCAARRQVTRYLAGHRDGRTILASMGSLAHYMQETSAAGFDLKDFVHEGNGSIWASALANPRRFVGWIVIEEWAEGGDMLAAIARRNPTFLNGFERVAEGGGVALYRRVEQVPSVQRSLDEALQSGIIPRKVPVESAERRVGLPPADMGPTRRGACASSPAMIQADGDHR